MFTKSNLLVTLLSVLFSMSWVEASTVASLPIVLNLKCNLRLLTLWTLYGYPLKLY